MQLEFFPAPIKATTLADIFYGNCCQVIGSGTIVMKVKPTGFLLNSTVIGDILNRGDYIVVDMSKGTMYSMKKTVPVRAIKARITIQPEA